MQTLTCYVCVLCRTLIAVQKARVRELLFRRKFVSTANARSDRTCQQCWQRRLFNDFFRRRPGYRMDSDTVTTIPPHADSRSLQL